MLQQWNHVVAGKGSSVILLTAIRYDMQIGNRLFHNMLWLQNYYSR